jgi:hypothetical protein
MLKTLFIRVVMMLALASGSGPALAGMFHVSLDTSSLAGRSGWLDFLFTGLSNAAPASAVVMEFTQDAGGVTFSEGDVAGSLGSTLAIGNGTGWNEFGQWVQFGGVFDFDVALDVGPAGAGTTLAIALLDEQRRYQPGTGDLVTFALQPGAAVAVTADGAFATVNAVPEPGTLAQVMMGLVLMVGVMAFKRRPWKENPARH